jgi:putative phage-type endonuclease
VTAADKIAPAPASSPLADDGQPADTRPPRVPAATAEPDVPTSVELRAAGEGLSPSPAADDRAEWLAWRRTGIGASDIAPILGLSPWGTTWTVWADKIGLAPEQEPTEAMEFGTLVETLLCDWYETKFDATVNSRQQRTVHPAWSHHLATLDGVAWLPTEVVLLECKSTSDDEWDEIPMHYQAQAQWQMHVTGLTDCVFVVLHMAFGRPKIRAYRLGRNDDDIALLIARVNAFWTNHVLTGNPPPIDGTERTTDILRDAWWPTLDETVEADPALVELVATIPALRAEADAATERHEAARNTIRQACGERTTLIEGYADDGRPLILATWKPNKNGVRALNIKTPKE